jgi:hypothetical protein
VKRKTALSIIIIFALLGPLVAGLQAVEVAKANFYMPPANTVWNIRYPLNSTYDTNYITLRFTVETNLGLLYFYSIDGQERIEINTTTLSKVPLPEYPPFIDGSLWNRITKEGTTELPYLSKGTHELTIYQIYPLSRDNPQNGNVVSQALIIFSISPSPSPTQQPTPTSYPPWQGDPQDLTGFYIFVSIIVLAIIIIVGILVYFKRRRR